MTIRRRLFWSNILMIAVPVALTVLVGLLCVGLIWLVMQQGSGLGLEDHGELTLVGSTAAETVAAALEEGDAWTGQLDSLATMLDAASLRLVVTEGGETRYTYGAAREEDAALAKAAAQLTGEDVLISAGDRGVHRTRLTDGGRQVEVILFGTPGEEHVGGGLRTAVFLSALAVVAAVVGSILLTNRFLTRFVFRRIEQPLTLLADGARRLGEGELDCRIDYAGEDEFRPVCQAFNEMARHLQASIAQTCREEESRKELLAGISHDLRSPLTSIRAYVEGLLDGVAATPAQQRRYLQTIRAKTEEIDRLVSQLFLFSEMALDQYPLLLRPLELSAWLGQLTDEVREEYRQRGLELSVQSTPVTVRADPEQLRRVVVNILDNSAKYKTRPVGRVEITVDEEETAARLTLTDDGPGVPEEALPRLFDVFYRSDPARSNPAGGSGLGLAIAARAVRQMGGGIGARLAPGGGLAIVITLPKEAEKR